jgi:hypothetical protein
MRDVPEACLMRSLADPCNAPLVHGSYPGVQGYITRTSKFFTVSLGAAETGFVAAIFPANNNSIIQTFTTTGTPTAFSGAGVKWWNNVPWQCCSTPVAWGMFAGLVQFSSFECYR